MGQDFEHLQDAHSRLKLVHKASNDANEQLLNSINELLNENAFLKAQLLNCEKNLNIQKAIVQNTLSSSQEKHDRDYQEIIMLKEEIKQLKAKLSEK